ncbi:TPA: hypothetical protein IB019_002243 [Escherichia coli]|nr:hypothetical protein [Escherichia coli]
MSQLNSVWVFSDNPERYAELFGGAQQWGQQVYAIVQPRFYVSTSKSIIKALINMHSFEIQLSPIG